MPRQIILTWNDNGTIDGTYDEGLSQVEIGWMLRAANVRLNQLLADGFEPINQEEPNDPVLCDVQIT